jgi:iron complex transport system permease protein
MSFQAMFRNPLAEPFTLGVASGASLGAALYVQAGLSFSALGISGLTMSAFIGALAAILLVYGLAHLKAGATSMTMLLAGVAISFFFSSLILFIQYVSDISHSFRILRWLMGGLDINGFESFFDMLPLVAAGSAIVLILPFELNLIAAGDDIALSRGVEVARIKKILFFAASLMVGGVVAICGPVGFVGMIAPHICRLLVGSEHRWLGPASFLFGGVFLVLCDTVARIVIAPAEMPVGIITALLGGPFFIWLLLRPRTAGPG